MAAHHAQLARRPAEQFRGAIVYVLMRGSVEPIAGDAALAPCARHAIHGSVGGHGGVEFCLKRGHQRDAGQQIGERANGLQIDRVVNGRSGPKLFERGDHAPVNDVSPSVLRPAVHGFERHGVNANFAGLNLRDCVAVVSNPLQTAFG